MIENLNPNDYSLYIDGHPTLHCSDLDEAKSFARKIQASTPKAEIAIIDNRTDQFVPGFAQWLKDPAEKLSQALGGMLDTMRKQYL